MKGVTAVILNKCTMPWKHLDPKVLANPNNSMGLTSFFLLLVEITDQINSDEQLRPHLLPSCALQELGGYKVRPPFPFRWTQTATNTDC